jgi:heme/copper-type cytochrome/quinol oxidase subunit 3
MQNKLMIKLTIGSEAIFFICLMVAYLYFWKSGNFQTAAAGHLDIKKTGVFTFLLLSSSFSFSKAENNYKHGHERNMKGWLLITIFLGLIFLAGQAHEYYNLLNENLTMSKSEFGSSFYTLTGFHGLHVLIGLILLSILFVLTVKGYFKNRSSSVITTIGIYWHFVDVVWIFVFTLIYVLPYIV